MLREQKALKHSFITPAEALGIAPQKNDEVHCLELIWSLKKLWGTSENSVVITSKYPLLIPPQKEE
jgi:hypothetical protein